MESLEVKPTIKTIVTSGKWKFSFERIENKIVIHCQTQCAPQYYEQSLSYDELPQKFKFIFENLDELYETLSTVSLLFDQGILSFSSKFGKVEKTFQMKIASISNSEADQIKELKEVLKRNQKLFLQQKNLMEKEKQQLISEYKSQILQQEYKIVKLQKEIIRLDKIAMRYIKCTKFICGNVIDTTEKHLMGRSGPICCAEHTY